MYSVYIRFMYSCIINHVTIIRHNVTHFLPYVYIFANMENYTEPLHKFSELDSAISNIKQGSAWLNGELGFNVLQQNSDSNVLIIAMHENTEFESFQANNSLIIKVVLGKLRFKINNKVSVIESGKMVILLEKAFYLIESMEESVFLLMTFNSFKNDKNYWLC